MGRTRREPTKSLRRKVAVRQPRKTLVVFCEGERTEPEYLEALKRDREVHDVAAVDLRIEKRRCGAVPLTLVQTAVEARNKAVQEEGEVDEFWCVFDVEWPRNHPALHQALDLARRNEVRVAVSNPCFEFWLILHFQDHRSFLDNDTARRLRRSLDRQEDKGLVGSLYMPRKKLAADRASVLEKMHAENHTEFPHNNPSSGMHRLVASLTDAKKPN